MERERFKEVAPRKAWAAFDASIEGLSRDLEKIEELPDMKAVYEAAKA